MAAKIHKIRPDEAGGECSVILSAEDMQKIMDDYPGKFLKDVMGKLDCSPLNVLYSTGPSRPSYPVNILVGILLLSIFTGFSHEMILNEIGANLRLRIALGVHKDPKFTPPDERTLDRFLARVEEYYKKTRINLLVPVLNPVLGGLCETLYQDGVIAFRLDSTLIDNYLTRKFRHQLIYAQTEVLVLELVGATKAEVKRYTKRIHPSIENIIPLHEGEDPVPFNVPERPDFFDKADSIGLPSILQCFFDADDYNKRFYSDRDENSKKSKQEDVLKMAKEVMDFCQNQGYTDLPEYKKLMVVLYFQCDLVKVIHPGEDPDSVQPELRLKPKNSEIKEAEAKEKQRTKLREGYEKAMVEHEKAAEKARSLKDKLDQEVGKSKVQRLQEQYDKAAKKETDLAQIVEDLKGKVEELDKQEATEEKVIYDEGWMENSHNMGSDGPQSHVDHSATYTKKYNKDHIGDKLTVIEAVDAKGRSRIIGFAYGPNNVGDSVYGAQLIREANKIFSLNGKIIVADAAFSGEGMDEAIESVGAILVNTNLVGTVKDCCADHEFSSDGKKLTKCAGGQEPSECTCNDEGKVKAKMDKEKCGKCSHKEECSPRFCKTYSILETSVSQKERALQKRKMGSETHNVLTRFRNGSEATMNLAQRVFPISNRPIYGRERKHMYATLCICVMAFRKALAQSKIKDPYHLQDYVFEEMDDCEPEKNCKKTLETEANDLGSMEPVEASTSIEEVENKMETDSGKDYEGERESSLSPENEDEDMAHSFESEGEEPSQVDASQEGPTSAEEVENGIETDTDKDYEEEYESELSPESVNEGMTHSFESEDEEPSQVDASQEGPTSAEEVENKMETDSGKDYEEEHESKLSPGNENEDMAHSFEAENGKPSQVDASQEAHASAGDADENEIETDIGKDYEGKCESEHCLEKENEGMAHSFEPENGESSQADTTQDTENVCAFSNDTHESQTIGNDCSQSVGTNYSPHVKTQYFQPVGAMMYSSLSSIRMPTSLVIHEKCGYSVLILQDKETNIPWEQTNPELTGLGLDTWQVQRIFVRSKQQLFALWGQMDIDPLGDIPLDRAMPLPWRPTEFTSQEMMISGTMDTTLLIPCNPTIFITYEPITQLMETNKYQLIRPKIFIPPETYYSQIAVTGRFKSGEKILSHLMKPDSS